MCDVTAGFRDSAASVELFASRRARVRFIFSRSAHGVESTAAAAAAAASVAVAARSRSSRVAVVMGLEMTVEVVVVEVAAVVLAIRFCCCCWPFRSDATSNVNRNAFGNLIASFSSGGSGGRGGAISSQSEASHTCPRNNNNKWVRWVSPQQLATSVGATTTAKQQVLGTGVDFFFPAANPRDDIKPLMFVFVTLAQLSLTPLPPPPPPPPPPTPILSNPTLTGCI